MARTEKRQFNEGLWIQLIGQGEYLTTSEKILCIEILKSGAAVSIQSAEVELSMSPYVALVTNHDEDIVGLGAVKRTREDYAVSTAKKSGFDFVETMAELGYIAVQNQYEGKGIAKAIVGLLLGCCPYELFATTYNARMAKILEKYGFCKRGHTWRNVDNTTDVSLYLRIL